MLRVCGAIRVYTSNVELPHVQIFQHEKTRGALLFSLLFLIASVGEKKTVADGFVFSFLQFCISAPRRESCEEDGRFSISCYLFMVVFTNHRSQFLSFS